MWLKCMCIIVEYEKQWNLLVKISIKNFDMKTHAKETIFIFIFGKIGLKRKTKFTKNNQKKKNQHKIKPNPNHFKFLLLTENLL